MDRVKILVAEDDLVVATNLRISLEEMGYMVLGTVETGEEIISKVEQEQPDLIILDIDLAGNLSGIQTADFLQKKYTIPYLFLTSHSDPATLDEAIATRPAAYLVKPFEEANLRSSIELAIFKAAQQQNAPEAAPKESPTPQAAGSDATSDKKAYLLNDAIFVKSKNRLEKLILKDIYWVEASDIYSLLHTEKTKYIVNYSLKVMAEKFPEKDFMRVHRSYMVNMHKIEAIEDHYLIVNKEYIPIGKTYREKLMKQLEIM